MRRKANRTCADYFLLVRHPDWKGAETVVTGGGVWKEILMRNFKLMGEYSNMCCLIINCVVIESACFDPMDLKNTIKLLYWTNLIMASHDLMLSMCSYS